MSTSNITIRVAVTIVDGNDTTHREVTRDYGGNIWASTPSSIEEVANVMAAQATALACKAAKATTK